MSKLSYLYPAFVLLISILPVNGPNSPMNDTYVVQLRLDYLLHGLLFLPVPFFLSHIARGARFYGHKLLMTFFLSLLFAILCELIQEPIPWRTFNINDLLANVAGVVAGMGIAGKLVSW
jgi:glycopeptide antibiotics resistance protein